MTDSRAIATGSTGETPMGGAQSETLANYALHLVFSSYQEFFDYWMTVKMSGAH